MYEFLENIKLPSNISDLAQLGDSINPWIAFFSFILLLITIIIQSKELKLSRQELEATREELEKSRIAQEEQSKSLELQNKATELQMIENSFFQLFKLLNDTKDNLEIRYEHSRLNECYINRILFEGNFSNIHNGEFKSFDAFKVYFEFNKQLRNFGNSNNWYRNKIFLEEYMNEYFKTYFNQVFSLLEFINKIQIDRVRYIRLLKGQLSKYEIGLLLLNVSSNFKNQEFKLLLEKYSIFEGFEFVQELENEFLSYHFTVYGNNEELVNKYKELEAIK